MASHGHTGFHYTKLVTYLSYDYGWFSDISDMDLGVSGYRKMPNLHPN